MSNVSSPGPASSRHFRLVGVLALTLTAGLLGVSRPAAAQSADARVAIASAKSFEQVSGAVKSLVAKNGMMVMAEVDQGKMLSMTGLKLKSTLFLIGNPAVGKQLFEQNQAVGLYVPLRVAVYVDGAGKTFVEYDRPSSVLAQFHSEPISMIAQMLDEKLGGMATMAAQ